MNAWNALVLVLLVGAVVLAAVLAWILAWVFVHPPRMTDGKAAWVLRRLSPGDLGLGFTPVWYEVRDEATGEKLQLAAWWVPAARDLGRTMVLIHGHADAKVGAIAWGPIFHDLGWNLLVIDLRAHGESDGKHATAGVFERQDVSQVIDQLRAELPGETARLALFGASLGAMTALGVAEMRGDLAGVILDSPFADLQHACSAHAGMLGLPGGWLQKLAMRVARRMTGADFAAIRPVEMIGRAKCKVMVIHGGRDGYVREEDIGPMRQAVEGRRDGSVYWLAPEAEHLMAMAREPEEYRRRVGEFLALAGAGGEASGS